MVKTTKALKVAIVSTLLVVAIYIFLNYLYRTGILSVSQGVYFGILGGTTMFIMTFVATKFGINSR